MYEFILMSLCIFTVSNGLIMSNATVIVCSVGCFWFNYLPIDDGK